jgi:ribonuclease HII
LVQLHETDPRYGFADHKGYATPEHIAALKQYGPSLHHRSGWYRVREAQLAFGFEPTDDDTPLEELAVN